MENPRNRPVRQSQQYRDDLQVRDTHRQSDYVSDQQQGSARGGRQITLTSPLGDDVLLFYRMSASEQLARLFEYRLQVFAEDGDIDFADLLGENVTVRLALPEETLPNSGADTRDTDLASGETQGGLV